MSTTATTPTTNNIHSRTDATTPPHRPRKAQSRSIPLHPRPTVSNPKHLCNPCQHPNPKRKGSLATRMSLENVHCRLLSLSTMGNSQCQGPKRGANKCWAAAVRHPTTLHTRRISPVISLKPVICPASVLQQIEKPFGSTGQMTAQAESKEGHKRSYTFQNADVTVHIIATGLRTDEDNDVLCQKRGGEFIRVPTGEAIAVERRHGVCFIELLWDWHILQP